jgi:bifunctional DNA-binding transcriptional regulator/antitoxin component of YhaV-PrlF toxin-antitoxin module
MEMITATTKMDEQGRIFLPASIRKAIAVRAGAEIVLQCEAGKLTLQPRDKLIADIQNRLRRRRGGRRSAVQEFLSERRKEAERELGK